MVNPLRPQRLGWERPVVSISPVEGVLGASFKTVHRGLGVEQRKLMIVQRLDKASFQSGLYVAGFWRFSPDNSFSSLEKIDNHKNRGNQSWEQQDKDN